MKTQIKLFAFLMLISTILFSSCSQEIYVEKRTNPYKFTEIINVDSNISKDILYTNARLWFMNTFKDSKSVLEVDDRVNYTIAGKGNFNYEPRVFSGSEGTRGYISFSVYIFIKNGKYKYEITNFYHNSSSLRNSFPLGLITDDKEYTGKKHSLVGNGWYNRVNNDIKEQINLQMENIISDLKKNMLKNNSDW